MGTSISRHPVGSNLSYGYVFELEQRLSTTQNILTRLLTWAESVGGREAAVWNEACRLLTPSDMTEPNAPKEIR